MALPLKSTLGELRSELIDRLGFSNQNQSARGILIPKFNSFLVRAQQQIWHEYALGDDKSQWDFNTAIDQKYYDWPNDCDPDRLVRPGLWISRNPTSTNPLWEPMEEGISGLHDSVNNISYWPIRYDRFVDPSDNTYKIELWPVPDASTYKVRIEGYRLLKAFAVDSDRTTVDSSLVFHLALAKAKADYEHKDADICFQQFERMLKNIRSKTRGNARHIRTVRGGEPRYIYPRPGII